MRKRFFLLAFILFGAIVACNSVSPPQAPAPAENVILEFQSLTFPGHLWTPFMPPVVEGVPETISGQLQIPESSGQVPAVVIAHGCGSVSSGETGWATRLNERGIATFIVHSFGARHIPEVCTGQYQVNIATVLADAYAALELLAEHPRIDPDRIAILGLSFGGRTALWTAHQRFYELYGGENRFVAHLAFYPSSCYIQLADETKVSGAPMRIFHGEADDWTPVDQCQDYVIRLQEGGVDIKLYAYADALHSFDDPSTPLMNRPLALSPRNCTFVEQNGQIIDVYTGQVAGIGSTCVTRGVTLGYNATAEKMAVADVTAFLDEVFKLDTTSTEADETTAIPEIVEQQPPTALPFIMNRGAPANERCVVTNPQALEVVVNVYAAPDLQSVLVAQLGNWADVLQVEDSWYKVLIPQGGTGWVQVEQVTLGGDCSSK